MARLSEGKGYLGPHRLGGDVSDPAVGTVTPGPAAAVVEHSEFVTGSELSDRFGVGGRFAEQRGGGDQMADQRLGIVRGDHAAGQGDVGEVLAIGVGCGIWEVGGAGEGEPVNDRRVPVPAAAARRSGAGRRRRR